MDKLASMLADQRLKGQAIDRLPHAEMMPVGDAYELQKQVNAILAEHLGPVAGSKIGASNKDLQRLLRVDEPLVGEVFASTIHPSGIKLNRSDFQHPGVETEIAVTLGRDVTPGEDWMDAIASLHAAIEIVDNRYVDLATAGAATFVADNVFNAVCIAGPPLTDWKNIDLKGLKAECRINGMLAGEGVSANLMGGPMETLTWLFDLWRRQRRVARKDWFISLGTMCMVQWLDHQTAKDGWDIRIKVERLGEVACLIV